MVVAARRSPVDQYLFTWSNPFGWEQTKDLSDEPHPFANTIQFMIANRFEAYPFPVSKLGRHISVYRVSWRGQEGHTAHHTPHHKKCLFIRYDFVTIWYEIDLFRNHESTRTTWRGFSGCDAKISGLPGWTKAYRFLCGFINWFPVNYTKQQTSADVRLTNETKCVDEEMFLCNNNLWKFPR